MSISFKGDDAKLARLQAMVRQVGSPDTRAALAKTLGAEALSLVQLGFRNGEDPYGAAWAPLKHRNGKPLLDKGRLRSSFSVQPAENGFVLGTNVAYAKFHQYGARGRRAKGGARRRNFRRLGGGAGLPARMMLPDGDIGSKWATAFRETSERFFSRIMKR